MLEWLADNVSVFKIQHDAHREFHMSVQQHLAHRVRIGNSPLFLNARDCDICIANNSLWELRVILADASTFDIAGSSLDNCVTTLRNLLAHRQIPAAA